MAEEHLHVTEVDTWPLIKDISDKLEWKEAFYICDLNDVIKKFETWMKLVPKITPYYAVKCNPYRPVLQTLATIGVNFDCASKNEIETILSLGVPPNRIIFAHPTKFPSHIAYAAKSGVSRMTFDCECELHKIKSLFPSAETFLRIRCNDPTAMYSMGDKFGCDSLEEAKSLLKKAKSLNINIVGIAFHIGSSSKNPKIFRDAIAKASKVFDIATSLEIDLKILDIGGGFEGAIGTSLDETADIINQALADFFPYLENLQIISEPGRYFVSSAFTLVANVHTVKYDKENLKCHYYINEGVFSSFIAVLYGEDLPGRPLNDDNKNASTYLSNIWGQTCDSSDKVAKDVSLPKLDVGDWLVFENMGAYTLSLASKFNGYGSPVIHILVNGKNWQLLEKHFGEDKLGLKLELKQ